MTKVKLPKNLGLGLALRVAIEACNFDLIARMDADDIARTDRFALQEIKMRENPNLVLLGGSIEEFSELKGDLSRVRHVPQTDTAIRKRAFTRNPFCHTTVIFRKCAVLAAGNYRHQPGFEDYDLWLRMFKLPGEFLNLNEILVDVRVGNGLIRRRRGWSYLLAELRFLKSCWQNELISGRGVLISSLVRIPARILPAFTLDYLYSKLLRRDSKSGDLAS
jgi:glycosyltransferase involved in cell wall biosynthesis